VVHVVPNLVMNRQKWKALSYDSGFSR
jgi:hypothetical protein